jgi:hypothetical protein
VKRVMVAALGILVVALLLPFEAVACTYFPPTYKAGSKFVVHVASGDGLTFAGVRVFLMRGTRVANSVRTDTQGVARFEAVGYGEYSIVPLTVIPNRSTAGSIDLRLSVLGSSCADANPNQETDRAD